MNLHDFFENGQYIASKAWNSKGFCPVLFIVSLFALVTDTQLPVMYLLVVAVVLLLVFCDDLLSIVCPILCIFLLSTKYYTDYTSLVPYVPYAAVPFAAAAVFNLVHYRRPHVGGRFTLPLCAVSAAWRSTWTSSPDFPQTAPRALRKLSTRSSALSRRI
mgnify:CR=1 FL=1